jgi:hypothetical protein
MEGPSRGLRRPVPVHSAPALVHVVGKAGEVLSADKADPEVLFSGELQLAYGSPGVHELRRLARLLGRRELGRRTGQSAKVFERFLAGGSTSPEVLAAVSAVASSDPSVGEPLPRCARPGCSMPARERSRWCSEACKEAAQRARRSEGSAADDIDQDALARVPQCPRCATFLLGATSRHICEGASS